jgi:itaconate CoA-transferase
VEPVMNPIPDVGEHTESILKEFGFENQIIGKI